MSKVLEFLKNAGGYLLTGAKVAVESTSLIPNLFSEAVGEIFEDTLEFAKDKYTEHKLYKSAEEKLSALSASHGEGLLDALYADILTLKGKKPSARPKVGKAYVELMLESMDALTPEAISRVPSCQALSDADRKSITEALISFRSWLTEVCLEAMDRKDQIFVQVLAERMKNEFHGELEAFKSELRLTFYGNTFEKLDECPSCFAPASGDENDLTAGVYRCKRCGRHFSLGEKTDLANAFHFAFEKELEGYSRVIISGVGGIISERDEKKIKNATLNLRREVQPLHPDPKQVMSSVNALLSLDPENALATFFRLMYSADEDSYCEFLIKGDISSLNGSDRMLIAEKALDFIKSKNDISAVSAYLKRAIAEGEASRLLFERLYSEATKLDSEQYDPAIPRDLFIIYKHEDLATVRKLVKEIEEEDDYECFYSERNLQNIFREGDKTYWEKIFEAMEACRAILFVSTEYSRCNEGYHLKEMREWMKREHRRISELYPEQGAKEYGLIPKEYKKPRYEYFIGIQDCGGKTKRTIGHFFDGYNHGGTCNLETVCKFIDGVRENREAPVPAVRAVTAPATVPVTDIENELAGARLLAARGKMELAKEKYNSLLDLYPTEPRCYIGLLYVASSKYTVIDCPEVSETLALVREMRIDLSAANDDSFNSYLSRREKHFADTEAKRKADEEAKKQAGSKKLSEEERKALSEEITELKKRASALKSELSPAAPQAADFEINKKGVLTKYKGNSGDVVIPDSVTSIGSTAFRGCKSLTSVTIPDSVTSIGNFAFGDCESLTSVTIPDSVTLIGGFAFNGCKSLTSVTIPNSVTSIGDYAFNGCESLTSVKIPDSVTSIAGGAFSSCVKLNAINVVAGNKYYKSIDGSLYSKDEKTLIQYAVGKKDATFTIPNSVTSIDNGAFHGCESLTSVTIPNSVTSIGDWAFNGCESLTSISIPEGCSYADNSFPSGCKVTVRASAKKPSAASYNAADFEIDENGVLTKYKGNGGNVVIPDGVTSIGDCAFNGCESLTSVTIPDSVTSIGDEAFCYCLNLNAINVAAGNKYYKSIDGSLYSKDEKTLIQYAVGKKDATFTIPDSVTSIGDRAFNGCESLTSVTIPDSVTSIGDYAFNGCKSLTSVTIPNSVTSIGDYAFNGCESLTSVTIPDSVTSIGDEAFCYCLNLNAINVAAGNKYYKSIDGSLYSKDGKVLIQYARGKSETSFVIPDGVASIGRFAFYYCESLTSVTIPNSVTSIGDGAFGFCNGLTSVTIPDSVTSIDNEAFCGCNGLTSVTIPNSVTSLGGYAFWGCENLISVSVWEMSVFSYSSFPSNSKCRITERCFIVDKNGVLTKYIGKSDNVRIPDYVTRISAYAFDRCNNITSVSIPYSVTEIDQPVFSGCLKLTEIEAACSSTYKSINGNLYSINEKTLIRYAIGKSEISFAIPDGVTDIARQAFYECENLTNVTIPDSVTSIGDEAFCYCLNLNAINVVTSNKNYKSIDGSLYSKDGKVLIQYARGKSETSFVIPDGVASIGRSAFYCCESLTSVTIPNSVTSIGDGAFGFCNGLTSVTIPDSVTSIDDKTFLGCRGLTSVTIPNSATSIGSSAFFGCQSLKSIFVPEGCRYDYNSFLSGCKVTVINTADFEIKENGVLSKYKGKGGAVVIPDGVTVIIASAFYGRGDIESVVIPESVTEIDTSAFWNCKGLKSITIPSSVKRIGGSAFSGCTSLARVTVGGGVVEMGPMAFSDCTALESVTVPEGVTRIDWSMFSGCKSLKSVTLLGKVTEIRYSAFENCVSLTSVTVPDSVKYIGERAFAGCKALKKVTIPAGCKKSLNSFPLFCKVERG